jgi:hypothetical protein
MNAPKGHPETDARRKTAIAAPPHLRRANRDRQPTHRSATRPTLITPGQAAEGAERAQPRSGSRVAHPTRRRRRSAAGSRSAPLAADCRQLYQGERFRVAESPQMQRLRVRVQGLRGSGAPLSERALGDPDAPLLFLAGPGAHVHGRQSSGALHPSAAREPISTSLDGADGRD